MSRPAELGEPPHSHHGLLGFMSHNHHHSKDPADFHSEMHEHDHPVKSARESLLEGARTTATKGHSRGSSAPLPNADEFSEDPGLQELQKHALDKSEETTSTIRNCLRVAEDMKQEATKTIVQLHEQGEQIRRTHETAVVLEQELGKGEKLLASLGGIFSRPWRPKKAHEITGPLPQHDNPPKARVHAAPIEARSTGSDYKSNTSYGSQQQGSQFQSHVQGEMAKQDEAFSDLSNVLDQLKEMSMDMGTEIHRQNESLGLLQDDVTELEFRVKNANERGRQLIHR